jgi:NAD(P)-dependent dehydrogenase (short-subunit alcohol dehydrogenase family)
MHPLYEKVALITGGSSGIGRAMALRLAGHGARVAVAARNRTALDEVVREIDRISPLPRGERGRGEGETTLPALAITTDVTQADDCRRAVVATVAQFGRLDILLCSAGLSMRTYFENSDLAAMEQVVRVNFLGTLYATHFALPHVKKSRGSLVAMSSLTGLRGIPSYALYGATKFAVQGLYDSLRLELGRDGVHVGVVSPGFVDTPLRDQVLGPDGKIWAHPPDPPFRIWPVEKCADRIVRLIVKRRSRALLPAFAGPLLTLDHLIGGWIGDWILASKFPPEPRTGT